MFAKARFATVLGAKRRPGKDDAPEDHLRRHGPPREGREISLSGARTSQARAPTRWSAWGVVHVPEGREVFPLLTVAENLKMGAYTRSTLPASPRSEEIVYSYFPILKGAAFGRAAGTLSGGQQQMLAIGRRA